jgi:DNA processing protein
MTLWADSEPLMPTGLDDHDVAVLLALATLPHIGPATLVRCLRAGELGRTWKEVRAGRAAGVAALAPVLGSEKPQMRQAELAVAANAVDAPSLLARNRRAGHVLPFGDPAYPQRLLTDPEPPAILFAIGDLAPLGEPVVAVVGTRNATQAGREVAIDLGAGLAEAGVHVVSGLALGIDGAVHTGVLGAWERPPGPARATARPAASLGRPIGVIASGIDIAYPRRHGPLHRQVAGRGCLLSETPLGARPQPWRFPARNRIIAGLADAVVVVESRATGGSMLTASEALARDVVVLAVPGHPNSPASCGTNDLIADGAHLVRDVGDVLVAIGRGGTERVAVPATDPLTGTSAEQRAVLDALGVDPLALDELIDRAGLTLEATSAVLVELEEGGWVGRTGSWYQRTSRSTRRAGGRR